MFWENYENLCKSKGVSPNKAASQIGVSSGSVTAWKNGRIPRLSVLTKIAEYFNTSVEELLSTKQKPAEIGEPKSDLDVKFNKIWDTFSEEEKKATIEFMKMFKK